MATRMQQRRGTAAQWTAANPILAGGEIGFETDSGKFKIGDGVTTWANLSYYASADDIAGLIDGAPELLNTLNELAAAIGDDPDFVTTMASKQYVSDAIDTHRGADTNVHGIPDTKELVTQSDLSTGLANEGTARDTAIALAISNSENTLNNAIAEVDGDLVNHVGSGLNVHGIADTSQLATSSDVSTAVSNAITTHEADTSVHGISNTANLAYKTEVTTAQNAAQQYADDAVSTHNDDTTSVHGIADTTALATKTYADNAVSTAVSALTKSSVGLGNVNNTSDADKPVSTATQSALDLKAPLASPTFTGTVSGITKSMVGLGNVDNTTDANKPVSTATQTALDLKADLAGPTFTGTVTLPSTTSIGNVSATELGYVDGVTSSIQTQLNAKAPLASPTFTGTVNAANVTLSGNLTVSGTTTTVSSQNLVISDPMIYLGEGNTGNAADLGFVSNFNDGTYQHSGLVRDASDSKWKLFKGVTDEPTTTVNFAQGSLDALAVGAFEASSATIGNVSNTELQYLDGVTSAIQTQLNAKAPSSSPTLATPTITGALTLSASGVVFTDGTQTGEGVISRTPISQKTDSYTLSALTERDSLIEISKASAVTLTIPADSTLNFPIGTSLDILQTGAGQITIAGAVGVTVNATPGLKLRTQWSGATLFKRAANTWVVYGDLSA